MVVQRRAFAVALPSLLARAADPGVPQALSIDEEVTHKRKFQFIVDKIDSAFEKATADLTPKGKLQVRMELSALRKLSLDLDQSLVEIEAKQIGTPERTNKIPPLLGLGHQVAGFTMQALIDWLEYEDRIFLLLATHGKEALAVVKRSL